MTQRAQPGFLRFAFTLFAIISISSAFVACGDDDPSTDSGQADDDDIVEDDDAVNDDETTDDDDVDDDDDDDDDDDNDDNDDDSTDHGKEGWVVGYKEDSTGSEAVVWHDMQGAWTQETLPVFQGDSWLYDVDFVDTDHGWAVGTEIPDTQWIGLILHRDASGWSQETLPVIGTANWELYGVDFVDADHGWAVGVQWDFAISGALILKYDSGTWSQVSTPLIPFHIILNKVSFPTANKGYALGGTVASGLGAKYQNGNWTLILDPGLPGHEFSSYYDVEFFSTTDGYGIECSARGGWVGGDAYHFNGIQWQHDAVLLPGEQLGCPSAVTASPSGIWHAVGFSNINSGFLLEPFMWVRSGGTWSVETVQQYPIGNYVLYDIDFPEDGLGFAVGARNPYLPNVTTGAVFQYQAGNWQFLAAPSSGQNQYLMAVSYP